MRAYHHAQDILVFSALLLWLVFRRLRRPVPLALILLDFAIGLVAGLGLWSTLLTLPFVLAALLALGVEAIKVRYQTRGPLPRGNGSIRQGLLLVARPANWTGSTYPDAVKTQEAACRKVCCTANVGGGHSIQAIIQQLGGTFIYAVPSMFDSSTVCPHCVLAIQWQRCSTPGDAGVDGNWSGVFRISHRLLAVGRPAAGTRYLAIPPSREP